MSKKSDKSNLFKLFLFSNNNSKPNDEEKKSFQQSWNIILWSNNQLIDKSLQP